MPVFIIVALKRGALFEMSVVEKNVTMFKVIQVVCDVRCPAEVSLVLPFHKTCAALVGFTSLHTSSKWAELPGTGRVDSFTKAENDSLDLAFSVPGPWEDIFFSSNGRLGSFTPCMLWKLQSLQALKLQNHDNGRWFTNRQALSSHSSKFYLTHSMETSLKGMWEGLRTWSFRAGETANFETMEGGRPLTGSAKVLYMSKSESLLNHSFSSIFLGGMDHESLWLLLMIWFSQTSHLFLVRSSHRCDGSAFDMRVPSSEAAQPISTSWRRQVPPIPRRPGDPWWTLGWFFWRRFACSKVPTNIPVTWSTY